MPPAKSRAPLTAATRRARMRVRGAAGRTQADVDMEALSHACGVSCRVRTGVARPPLGGFTPRPQGGRKTVGSPTPAVGAGTEPDCAAGLGVRRRVSPGVRATTKYY